jgi:zinc transporter ZupT
MVIFREHQINVALGLSIHNTLEGLVLASAHEN